MNEVFLRNPQPKTTENRNKATFRIELSGIDFLEGRTHWVQAPRKTRKSRLTKNRCIQW